LHKAEHETNAMALERQLAERSSHLVGGFGDTATGGGSWPVWKALNNGQLPPFDDFAG